jgi:hypothetical protein
VGYGKELKLLLLTVVSCLTSEGEGMVLVLGEGQRAGRSEPSVLRILELGQRSRETVLRPHDKKLGNQIGFILGE